MTESPRALSGLRVVDLSRVVAGPLCTQMLADHGADVIKVEGPAGDELRTYGPPFGTDTSAYFEGINRNKRNICLDLSVPGGQEILWRLLEDADVVVENFRSGTMEKWGFGYDDALSGRFPRLVYCRITGFGTDGPMAGAPGYDAMLQAYAGLMSVSGEPEGPGTRVGLPIVDLTAAMLAFGGILLAVIERGASERGQLVDCTLLDAAVSLLHPHASVWSLYGIRPSRLGDAHPSVAPYQTFTTRTGPVLLAANNDRQFRALVTMLGCPEVAADERFATNARRVANREELAVILGAMVAEADGNDLAARLLDGGVPAAPVNEVPDTLELPQVRHRQMLIERDGYRGLGIPIKLSRTPGGLTMSPVPKGAHSRDILCELGLSGTEIDGLVRSGVAVEAGSPPPPQGVAGYS